MRTPRHPFALDTPAFSFPALASLASRAPLGGAREVAIAAFTTARMADEVRPGGVPIEERRLRAGAARRWISSFSFSEPVRKTFLDLIAATEADGPATTAAIRRVIEVTTGLLDAASRSELERLARDLEAQAVGRS